MPEQSIYTIGGTVHEGVYIRRKADEELLEHCRASEYAFILSSRQVGKSSLMVRTARQLEKEGVHSVIVDLSAIGVKISVDEWYLGILDEVANTLELKTDIFVWWSEHAGLGAASRMTNFFREVLLKEIAEPVVIFFDEIDSTLSINFSDDFFASLRAIYNARSTVPDFKRLSFVMIGVAAPSDLIADGKRTPFNIGRRVELTDFTLDEIHPLAEGLGENAGQVLTWVFDWTNGHPYLTQRLCASLSKSRDGLTQQTVETFVKDLFLGEKGMEDNNLQFVRDMLLERATDKSGVLRIYQRVITDKKPVADDEQSLNKSHLKLSGVVRRKQTVLRVSNLIYRQVFNLKWIKEHLPRLERRRWVMATSVAGALTTILASLLGVTGYLNSISYRPLKTDWVDVPAGEFLMGSTLEQLDQVVLTCQEMEHLCLIDVFADEIPIHSVYLNTYKIMVYEVTNEQYARCVLNGACEGGGYEYQDVAGNILNRRNDKAYANHPVVGVSWFQAESYCKWIGARLPTEAEWEKAARGENVNIYPWGNEFDGTKTNSCDSNCLLDWANRNFDDGYAETSPVGSYINGQSPYGVFDMAGNVWEWTADWYYNSYYLISPFENPIGPDSGVLHVIRGGSWYNLEDNVRSARRFWEEPASTFTTTGFRCAMDAE